MLKRHEPRNYPLPEREDIERRFARLLLRRAPRASMLGSPTIVPIVDTRLQATPTATPSVDACAPLPVDTRRVESRATLPIDTPSVDA